MCDILKSDFQGRFQEIVKVIEDSSFLSIDTEFSALPSNDLNHFSLFDSPDLRYKKVLNGIQDIIVFQVGISAFKLLRNQDKYVSTTYNFYIFPNSIATANERFTCQTAAIEFLASHKFNFNKLFYEGISFLNKPDEELVIQKLKDGTLRNNFEKLSNEDFSLVMSYYTQITNWQGEAALGSNLMLNLAECPSHIISFLIKYTCRKNENVWIFLEDNSILRVQKVSIEEYQTLQSTGNDPTESALFQNLLGFSKLMKEIIRLKKPIVGHNVYLDLVLIVQQFVEPLPVSYLDFKKLVSDLFPDIYDTKILSSELRSITRRADLWKSNTLEYLYDFFSSSKSIPLAMYSPKVECDPNMKADSNMFHNAGFDSFCCGYCFVKLGHAISMWRPERNAFAETRIPLSITSLLAAVGPYKNQVNVINGNVRHINLSGPDPSCQRPPFLHIESRGFQEINFAMVSSLFARYDRVEIKPYNRYRAVIAVGNHSGANQILERFQDRKDFRISKYNFILHSPLLRSCLWGGSAAAIAIGAVWFWKNKRTLSFS